MKKSNRKRRCPVCGSQYVLKWGVRDNHQRYKCNNCGRFFTPHRDDVSLSNRFPLFRKWVLGKRSLADLAGECGHSERQLRRWFDEWLDRNPKWTIRRGGGVNLLIDGTWFARNRCLIVYRDQTDRSTLYYRFSDREDWFEISTDLEILKAAGVRVHSVTTDGSEDIIRAVKIECPHAIRQRSLVHIERECLGWITQHPRSAAGIELRRLVCRIRNIRTNNDRLFWTGQLRKWHRDYEDFIGERSVNAETGEETYTHAGIRRAYNHLNNALRDMFKYIDHPEIPKDTNGIEAFFSHLKDNLRIHRGLSPEHHDNFIKWYIYFTNERKRKGEKHQL